MQDFCKQGSDSDAIQTWIGELIIPPDWHKRDVSILTQKKTAKKSDNKPSGAPLQS